MTEKRGRGQPKFEPTPDQRSRVKLMKALGIPGDRIRKTITNQRTGKPVAPMTLAGTLQPAHALLAAIAGSVSSSRTSFSASSIFALISSCGNI